MLLHDYPSGIVAHFGQHWLHLVSHRPVKVDCTALILRSLNRTPSVQKQKTNRCKHYGPQPREPTWRNCCSWARLRAGLIWLRAVAPAGRADRSDCTLDDWQLRRSILPLPPPPPPPQCHENGCKRGSTRLTVIMHTECRCNEPAVYCTCTPQERATQNSATTTGHLYKIVAGCDSAPSATAKAKATAAAEMPPIATALSSESSSLQGQIAVGFRRSYREQVDSNGAPDSFNRNQSDAHCPLQ